MIDVCITVDVEGSIGGAFGFPTTHRPYLEEHIWCPIGGRDHGLPFLLQTLSEFGLKGTFFVETEQVSYFSDSIMGRAVDQILAQGSEVEMHLHPCWSTFRNPDWVQGLDKRKPTDNCGSTPSGELLEMLQRGIATMRGWTGRSPVVFRSGGLATSTGLYKTLAAAGFSKSSNSAWGSNGASGLSHLTHGSHLIDGVTEIPVTSYKSMTSRGRPEFRILTTSSTSAAEMRHLVEDAEKKNISPVVLLTHPFEFIKCGRAIDPNVRQNRMVQERFVEFCRWLSAHPDRFRVTCMSDLPNATGDTKIPIKNLSSPLILTLMRMASNGINDRIGCI